jgi:hypothetical protein
MSCKPACPNPYSQVALPLTPLVRGLDAPARERLPVAAALCHSAPLLPRDSCLSSLRAGKCRELLVLHFYTQHCKYTLKYPLGAHAPQPLPTDAPMSASTDLGSAVDSQVSLAGNALPTSLSATAGCSVLAAAPPAWAWGEAVQLLLALLLRPPQKPLHACRPLLPCLATTAADANCESGPEALPRGPLLALAEQHPRRWGLRTGEHLPPLVPAVLPPPGLGTVSAPQHQTQHRPSNPGPRPPHSLPACLELAGCC